MHLNVNLSSETSLKELQDFLYAKSQENKVFTGLLEAVSSEITIVTAIHNIKSNKGSKTAGVDKVKMDKYLQMPKEEVVALIQNNLQKYLPKPARRMYINKSNGKKRPFEIPTILDRIIQECSRIIRAEKPRLAGKDSDKLVGKPFPNMVKLSAKITKVCDEIHAMKHMKHTSDRIPHIHEGYRPKTHAIKHQKMWMGGYKSFPDPFTVRKISA